MTLFLTIIVFIVFLVFWLMKTNEREILKFIKCLQGQSGKEIGLSLAIAFHFKNKILNVNKLDLMDPLKIIKTRPLFILDVTRYIKLAQKNKEYVDAAGGMIWLHTLRAAANPEIRIYGRQMWAQLERGQKYVEEQANFMASLTGKEVLIDDFDKFPIGLEPYIS